MSTSDVILLSDLSVKEMLDLRPLGTLFIREMHDAENCAQNARR